MESRAMKQTGMQNSAQHQAMFVSTVGGGAMTMVFRTDDPVKYPSVTTVKVPVGRKEKS